MITNNIFSYKLIKGIWFFALLAVLSFVILPACSSHDCGAEEPETQLTGDFYFSFNVNLPQDINSRSETKPDGSSSSGQQGATNPENALLTASLYIADDKGNVLLILDTPTSKIPSANNGFSLTYLVKSEEIKKLTGKTLELYMVGNQHVIPNQTLSSTVSPMDATFTVDGLETTPIGKFGENGKTMPLVNAKKYKVDFTEVKGETDQEILESLKEKFEVSDNRTFPITEEVLKLERAVARFDISDKDANDDFKYEIEGSNLNLKLFSLQPLNVNNEAYLYRHVVNGSTITAFEPGEMHLLEVERGKTGYNWVANPDWDLVDGSKNELTGFNKVTIGKNSINNDVITGVNGTAAIHKISTITSECKSKYPETVENVSRTYYPFCYVMENTVPTVELMEGSNLWKYATGLAFTFRILDKDGKPLTTSTTSDQYPTEVSKQSGNTIRVTLPNGLWKDVDYDSVNEGYFLTYYAFIKHNVSQTIKAMEYAVVRNNVYQISVNSIKNLPDPEYPDLVFEVYSYVVPWELRTDDDVILK